MSLKTRCIRSDIPNTQAAVVPFVRPRKDVREREFLTIGESFPNLLSCDEGDLAEWLGSGLQIRLQRFDSASRLFFLVSLRGFSVSGTALVAGFRALLNDIGSAASASPFIRFVKGVAIASGW